MLLDKDLQLKMIANQLQEFEEFTQVNFIIVDIPFKSATTTTTHF